MSGNYQSVIFETSRVGAIARTLFASVTSHWSLLQQWFGHAQCAHPRQSESFTVVPARQTAVRFFHRTTSVFSFVPYVYELFGRRVTLSPMDADAEDDGTRIEWEGTFDTDTFIDLVSAAGWRACQRTRTCRDCHLTLLHEEWHRALHGGLFRIEDANTWYVVPTFTFHTLFLAWWSSQLCRLHEQLDSALKELSRLHHLLRPTDHWYVTVLREGAWHLLHGTHPPATSRQDAVSDGRSCSAAA